MALAVVLGAGLPLACDNPVFESAALKGASDLGGDAPVIETLVPENEVTVYSANQLQSALTSGKINVINVAKSFDSNVSAIVTVPKTIKIAKNYRVRIAALHTKAAVTLAPGNAQPAQSAVSANIVADTAQILAAETGVVTSVSQADIGIFEIKKTLIVAAGTDISVKTGTNLVLGEEVTAQTTKIDGSLAQDEAGLIYHLGGGVTVRGDGGITSGEESVKEIASGAILGAPAGGMPTETADKPQTVNVNGNDEGTDGGDEEPPEDEEDEGEEEEEPPNIGGGEGGWQGLRIHSVTLDEHELALEAGNTAQLTATLDATGDISGVTIEWSSSDSYAVSVDQTGLVTAKSATNGVTITAKAGNKTDACVVTVTGGASAGLYRIDIVENEEVETSLTVDGTFSLATALNHIKTSANTKDGDHYLIVLDTNEDAPDGGYYIGNGNGTKTSTGTRTNLTITLKGAIAGITITKTGITEALFTVYDNANNTANLILENIILSGNSLANNQYPLVTLGGNSQAQKGILTMKAGSRITGNTGTGNRGAGVNILVGSTFNMEGGSIDGNTTTNANSGHGAAVLCAGTFNMTGGVIARNTMPADKSFGVVSLSGNNATFTKTKATGGVDCIIYGVDDDDEPNTNTGGKYAIHIQSNGKTCSYTAGNNVALNSANLNEGWE